MFSRNTDTGVLTQQGCLRNCGASEDGARTCARVRDLNTGDATPAAGSPSRARPPRSAGLKPLTGRGACVSDSGNSPLGPNTCMAGRGLFDVERTVLSANQKFIYSNGFQNP